MKTVAVIFAADAVASCSTIYVTYFLTRMCTVASRMNRCILKTASKESQVNSAFNTSKVSLRSLKESLIPASVANSNYSILHPAVIIAVTKTRLCNL